ncbi:MAG: hypothetical protein AB7U26_06490 [Sulfuricurvum sp.]
MRWLLCVAVAVFTLQGAQAVAVGEKYKDSGKCKACHSHIVKEWESSWHAASHYANDEYFRKTIDYVARKQSGKSLNSIKIECAACHNPRISVTSTNAEYEALASLNLDRNTDAACATQSDTIAEGINCVVCHNIDRIHDTLPDTKRGVHRVGWMKSGTMSGPYSDAKSPYHRVEHRDFMDRNPDRLCFVCHANDTSEEGHRFTDMESEYKKGDKFCVDCHMGPRKEGVAATLRDAQGKPHKRQIRSHGFIGAHTETMWKDALAVSLKRASGGLEVTLNNPNPHPLPGGFGAREILIEVAYFRKGKGMGSQTRSLTSRFLNKRGKPTVPHLAAKTLENVSVPAYGSKSFTFGILKGADQVAVSVSYRLVNEEVRKMLGLKDPIWSRKAVIQKKVLKL